MSLEENTSTEWVLVIADLTANRQTTLQHPEKLRAEKRSLALDAAMGNEEARKRISKIKADLSKLVLECDDFEVAIRNAEQEKQKAQDNANAEAERQRQDQLRDAVRAYYAGMPENRPGPRETRGTAQDRAGQASVRRAWGGSLRDEAHSAGPPLLPAEERAARVVTGRYYRASAPTREHAPKVREVSHLTPFSQDGQCSLSLGRRCGEAQRDNRTLTSSGSRSQACLVG